MTDLTPESETKLLMLEGKHRT